MTPPQQHCDDAPTTGFWLTTASSAVMITRIVAMLLSFR